MSIVRRKIMRAYLISKFFPGSLAEYEEAKRMHSHEIRQYRRRWHFVVGLVLFGGPPMVAMASDVGWTVKVGAVLMVAGFIFIQDTITQHYCLKIIRERRAR